MSYDAIVIAGGGARRLGGVDKMAVTVGGRTLLDRTLAACAGAGTTTVVGPRRPTLRRVAWAREEPAGGGPLAGLEAGLRCATAPTVVVLAGDLPFLEVSTVRELLDFGAEDEGAVFNDGRDQPLLAAYRAEPLRRELALLRTEYGSLTGLPVRLLLPALRLRRVGPSTSPLPASASPGTGASSPAGAGCCAPSGAGPSPNSRTGPGPAAGPTGTEASGTSAVSSAPVSSAPVADSPTADSPVADSPASAGRPGQAAPGGPRGDGAAREAGLSAEHGSGAVTEAGTSGPHTPHPASERPEASEHPGTSERPGASEHPGTSERPGTSEHPGAADVRGASPACADSAEAPGSLSAVDCDTWEDIAAARARIRDDGTVLDEWTTAVKSELGIDLDTTSPTPEAEDLTVAILDLARDAAHSVARPAAPLTTFLVGYAAAQRGGSPEEVAETARRAAELAKRWAAEEQP